MHKFQICTCFLFTCAVSIIVDSSILPKPFSPGLVPQFMLLRMSLRTIYERFLGSPNPSSLSDDVSLNYITSLKTFAKPEAVVRHLEKQNKNEVRKKGEKVLGVVEGQYSLSLDLEMSLEFVSSGGAYLPGLENFVADRVVTFPCVRQSLSNQAPYSFMC